MHTIAAASPKSAHLTPAVAMPPSAAAAASVMALRRPAAGAGGAAAMAAASIRSRPFSSSSSSSGSSPYSGRPGRRRARPPSPSPGPAPARKTRPLPPPFAAVATASPFVWAGPGMEPDLVLPSSRVRGKARALFAAPAAFLDPASLKYALPEVTSPRHTEVAFLGRSNVGKSSLVNALLKDAAGGSGRGLVRTSKTPGCTQTLNLYRLVANTDPLFLVDLPGYGYAKAPETERQRWMDVSLSYLETRGMDVLRRTMLLIDARHGVKPQDEEAMAAFDARAVPYQLVLTKADALRSDAARKQAATQALAVACKREHAACWPVVHLTSAKTDLGIAELREGLAALMYHDDNGQ